jgi:hypothetical protein
MKASRWLVGVLIVGVAAASWGGSGNGKNRRPGVVLYQCKAQMSAQERTALAAVLLAHDVRLERKVVNGTILRVKAQNLPAGNEEALAAELEASGGVEWAEPDYVEEAVTTPNDPYYASQWQHLNIRSAGAWTSPPAPPRSSWRCATPASTWITRTWRRT